MSGKFVYTHDENLRHYNGATAFVISALAEPAAKEGKPFSAFLLDPFTNEAVTVKLFEDELVTADELDVLIGW